MNNPVSRTAWFCAGVRALDAQRADSLLQDTFAERFLAEEGRAVFERFRTHGGAHATTVVRAHVIDSKVRAHLTADPQRRVVLVGAGFDSRAFRLPGGRWVEIDEAAVLDRKEAVAPVASCPNPLERVPIDFATESLPDKLAPYGTADPVLVIVEGVLLYLEPPQIRTLLDALAGAFPRHTLLCDVMTRGFMDRYAGETQAALAELGAAFRLREHAPAVLLTGAGYQLRDQVSLALRAAELGRMPMPPWLVRWLFRALRDGYTVLELER